MSTKSQFLFIRGRPATGKITVARIIEKELGWKVFWLHELKNTVVDIVKEHRIPRLMDDLTASILRFIMDRGDNVIFVRPSPDKETVNAITNLVSSYEDYGISVFRLTASYDNLLERATSRDDEYRIRTKEELDGYIQSREEAVVEGEYIIVTDSKTPRQVADEIIAIIRKDI
ncbi:hypothetical protein EOL73_03285 [Candidatus Saccharibacteria bacterium]|nr:hypothetical protein [Candidatus Saccharibacteria bacterium]NCU40753.1 hypothetical protein [Candidatus Saccharibacteria bacterium]